MITGKNGAERKRSKMKDVKEEGIKIRKKKKSGRLHLAHAGPQPWTK